MTKAEIIEVANTLIGYGKVKEALEALSEYVKGVDKYSENDLLMQMATFNRNHRDYHNRLITKESYDMVMARLNYALTQITDRLPEEGNEVVADLTPPPDPGEAPTITPAKEKDVKKPSRIILFLSASPKNMPPLRLGEEMKKVKMGLKMGRLKDSIDLEIEPSVTLFTLTGAMQEYNPEIIHFSGHGEGVKGLAIEDDIGNTVLFPNPGLKRLFGLFKDQVKCVVLNACYSKEQAEIISKYGIYVIGMNDEIGDKAAIAFSVGFYQSIGEGKDFEFAYGIGMVHVSPYLKDANMPELWKDGKRIDA